MRDDDIIRRIERFHFHRYTSHRFVEIERSRTRPEEIPTGRPSGRLFAFSASSLAGQYLPVRGLPGAQDMRSRSHHGPNASASRHRIRWDFLNHCGGQAMEVIRGREGDCRQEVCRAIER
jgi:hypothetical protein